MVSVPIYLCSIVYIVCIYECYYLLSLNKDEQEIDINRIGLYVRLVKWISRPKSMSII